MVVAAAPAGLTPSVPLIAPTANLGRSLARCGLVIGSAGGYIGTMTSRQLFFGLAVIAGILHLNATEIYCYRANRALTVGQLDEAARLVEVGLSYDPGNRSLIDLMAEIRRMKALTHDDERPARTPATRTESRSAPILPARPLAPPLSQPAPLRPLRPTKAVTANHRRGVPPSVATVATDLGPGPRLLRLKTPASQPVTPPEVPPPADDAGRAQNASRGSADAGKGSASPRFAVITVGADAPTEAHAAPPVPSPATGTSNDGGQVQGEPAPDSSSQPAPVQFQLFD